MVIIVDRDVVEIIDTSIDRHCLIASIRNYRDY
jgi:hypothetical protein